MIENPLVSVVIPMYNAEKYIDECIESVKAQTYTDVEIIVVDDGSTDGGGYYVDRQNIKVIRQINQGVTKARETGVNHSTGDWIMFVDADDTISPKMVETLVAYAHDDVDLVIGEAKKSGCFTPHEMRKSLLGGNIFSTAPWGKLYRRRLFDNPWVLDIPRTIVHAEDVLMLLRLSWGIRGKIQLVNNNLYNYRLHAQQLTSTFFLTSSYEDIFHPELLKSFPSESDRRLYRNQLIYCQLTSIELILLGVRTTHDKFRKSKWYQNLLNDIRRENFKVSFWHKLMMAIGTGWNIRVLRKIKDIITA